MRPPEFTGGNPYETPCRGGNKLKPSFNEAAGIHRRKLCDSRAIVWTHHVIGFNEAAGIHRRKPESDARLLTVLREYVRLQ